MRMDDVNIVFLYVQSNRIHNITKVNIGSSRENTNEIQHCLPVCVQ